MSIMPFCLEFFLLLLDIFFFYPVVESIGYSDGCRRNTADKRRLENKFFKKNSHMYYIIYFAHVRSHLHTFTRTAAEYLEIIE